jgi:hypothetical protein
MHSSDNDYIIHLGDRALANRRPVCIVFLELDRTDSHHSTRRPVRLILLNDGNEGILVLSARLSHQHCSASPGRTLADHSAYLIGLGKDRTYLALDPLPQRLAVSLMVRRLDSTKAGSVPVHPH